MTETNMQNLIRVLESGDGRVLEDAIFQAGRLGKDAQAAVPALLQILLKPNQTVRWKAAVALRNIGPIDPPVIKTLVECHAEGDGLLRKAAAYSLATIDARAKAAIPVLLELTHHEKAAIREAAVFALGRIGPMARDASDRLRVMSDDTDPNVRRQAMIAQCCLGTATESGLHPMRKEIEGNKALAAEVDKLAKGELKLGELSIAPMLMDLMKSEHTTIRKVAAVAIATSAATDDNSMTHLGELLKDERWRVREAAAFALGQIGKGAQRMLPSLLEALKDQEDKVRKAAFLSIHKIVN